jgi:hypothetical protein
VGAVNKDYDPSEYMKKLRSHKVYRNGRIQLWASLKNMIPSLEYWWIPVLGFGIGFVAYKLLA